MEVFLILMMAGFAFLFLLMIDHGTVTLKALRIRWGRAWSRTAKLLPFGASVLGSRKRIKPV